MEFFFPPLLRPRVVCDSASAFFKIQRVFILCLYQLSLIHISEPTRH